MGLFSKKKNLILIGLSGPQEEETIRIERDGVTLGGPESGADLIIVGTGALHIYAEFRRRDKRWVLIRRWHNAVFVNDREHPETPVGENDVVKFARPGGAEPVAFRVQEVDAPREPGGSVADIVARSWKWVAAGLFTCGYAAGFFWLYLTFFAEGADQNAVQQLRLEEVRREIDADMRDVFGEGSPSDLVLVAPEHFYGRILCDTQSQGDEGEDDLGALRDRLKCELEAAFFDAWKLERQEQWDAARAVYVTIVDLLPDPGLRTTRLALKRISDLERE